MYISIYKGYLSPLIDANRTSGTYIQILKGNRVDKRSDVNGLFQSHDECRFQVTEEKTVVSTTDLKMTKQQKHHQAEKKNRSLYMCPDRLSSRREFINLWSRHAKSSGVPVAAKRGQRRAPMAGWAARPIPLLYLTTICASLCTWEAIFPRRHRHGACWGHETLRNLQRKS